MGRRPIIFAGLACLYAGPALADPIGPDPVWSTQGRNTFVVVGASMVDNQGLNNGVNCLKPQATATVTAADLPSRPTLLKATLYVAGTLIGSDGLDYDDPPTMIFETPDIRADDPAELPLVEDAAREAADTSVELSVPGAAAPVTVSATAGTSYVNALYKSTSSEQGNVAFFVTPIDVTAAVNAGSGLLGDYTVSGLLADVCNGAEVVCDDPPNPPTCSSVADSAPHTNGTASFALLLVVQDPELSLRSIAVFEGLRSMAQSNLQLLLSTTNAISNPAEGSLAFYALEGDLSYPTGEITATPPCNGDEYIEVDGDLDPTADGLCLVDDDNPLGNLFNATINVQPAPQPPGACTEPPATEHKCCLGDGLCPVAGADIDRFDISAGLSPGVNEVRVRVGSGVDRVALAVVMLEVGVFEPVLNLDSQIRLFQLGAGQPADAIEPLSSGIVRAGNRLVYSIALSNTGNVAAATAGVTMSAPTGTTGLEVLRAPPGSLNASTETGGTNNTGLVDVSGFAVPAGEIAEVRVALTPHCLEPGTVYSATATVTSTGLPPVDLEAPRATLGGPGVGACKEFDPSGPYAASSVVRDLRGGGGCRGSEAGLLAVAAVLLLLLRRRIKTGLLLLALGLSLATSACLDRRQPAGEPTQPTHDIVSADGLPGEACGSPLMVWVTRADDTRFCIDRFEATVDGGALGNAHQGANDEDPNIDGSTAAVAGVTLGDTPATGISWYQAKAACENAGKRLCTLAEWELACRGPGNLIYPYGDTMVEDACNGFFAYTGQTPAATGSLDTCGSAWGAYDLSGNLEEWVLDRWPRLPGSALLDDRAVRGGSYKSNSNALQCIGDEFHEPPGSSDVDRGFRCCADGPD